MAVDCEEKLKIEAEEGGEVVRWEEYLPRMVIRVLLVEADDSTRQIIAALLRKCNYKVTAIGDGLKAWEILKKKHSNIDLILTEVDLPSISGYALLTLIMEHESCKNIPVVMMSSSDSISMVFNCMLKGAADFLIKPVRRNELKNLWQHVWRRLSSNNASGVQNLGGGDCKPETSSKSRATENCLDDNVSSSKEKSQSAEKAIVSPDLLQLKPHLRHNEVQHVEKGMRIGGKTEKVHCAENSTMSEPSSSSMAHPDEVYALTSRLEQVGSSCGRMAQAQAQRIEVGSSCRNIDAVSSNEAIDLIGTINNQVGITRQEFTSNCEMHSNATQLELSLRRSSDPEEQKTDGKHRLTHSNASAFSRYSNNKKLRTLFPSLVNSPTKVEGGDKFHEDFVALRKPTNTLRVEEENESTVITGLNAHPVTIFPGPQVGLIPAPVYGPIYPPVFSPQASIGAVGLKSTKQKDSSPILPSTSLQSDPGIYCSSLGHSGFDETSNPEDQHKHVDAVRSNGFVALLHNNVTNDTFDQAMLGTCKAEEVNARDNGGNPLTSEQFASAKGGLHNSQREAALAKFRQKRKDRCFEKKVRYQSRKKLAEQRPRVKGQFVKQVQSDPPLADTDTRHEDNG